MKVLMVCSEFAPLAKTGGLADAITGLSNALSERGADVRVLLPNYATLRAPTIAELQSPDGAYRYLELGGPMRSGESKERGRRARHPHVYALDLAELTADVIYTGDSRDAGRFLRLADAALPLCAALDWTPDVIHCHDWHAALVPVVQRARQSAVSVPTVLTLHNIGYQGVFAEDVLEEFGFGALRAAMPPDAISSGNVNFLRAGVRAAGTITTVSPTYAFEIRTPAFGMGLEDAITERGDDVVGILNGVDYDVWGPTKDPFIEVRYDAGNIAPKYRLKGSLCMRLGLEPDQNAPLVGVVSRLVSQKGIDLLTAVLPVLLAETRANFAILGNGDAGVAGDLARFAAEQPRRVSFTDGYDEPLAHQIFAGSDVFLVPSRYEPCGLTQMYALRYGTIPVVRATGGLADTISHFDPATQTGNGSVFRDADPGGLLWGVRSALAWFDDPKVWPQIIANAMAADFSWRKQVKPYEVLYKELAA
jgi:starch synthase